MSKKKALFIISFLIIIILLIILIFDNEEKYKLENAILYPQDIIVIDIYPVEENKAFFTSLHGKLFLFEGDKNEQKMREIKIDETSSLLSLLFHNTSVGTLFLDNEKNFIFLKPDGSYDYLKMPSDMDFVSFIFSSSLGLGILLGEDCTDSSHNIKIQLYKILPEGMTQWGSVIGDDDIDNLINLPIEGENYIKSFLAAIKALSANVDFSHALFSPDGTRLIKFNTFPVCEYDLKHSKWLSYDTLEKNNTSPNRNIYIGELLSYSKNLDYLVILYSTENDSEKEKILIIWDSVKKRQLFKLLLDSREKLSYLKAEITDDGQNVLIRSTNSINTRIDVFNIHNSKILFTIKKKIFTPGSPIKFLGNNIIIADNYNEKILFYIKQEN